MIRLLAAQIFLAISLALVFPVHGIAQPRDSLVGTWRLVSAKDTTVAGEVTDSYGPNPTGFLTYTAEGRMIVVIANGGRKPLSVPDNISAPLAERAEAFATFLAYAGTYTVTGDRVVHHLEVHSIENNVNSDFVRFIERFDGDRLILRTPPLSRGAVHVDHEVLVWERVKEKTARH